MPSTSSQPSDPNQAQRLRVAEAIYQARRRRNAFFEGDALFGEPAYDIMLDLYIADCKGLQISVSSACIAADVPMTTALRYVSSLQRGGWVKRVPDPFDRRRNNLHLTDKGMKAINGWLERNINVDPTVASKGTAPQTPRPAPVAHQFDEIVPMVMRVDDRVYTYAESADGMKTGFCLSLAVARSLGFKLIEIATGRAHQKHPSA